MPKNTFMEDRMNSERGVTARLRLSGVFESYGVGFGGLPERKVVYVPRRTVRPSDRDFRSGDVVKAMACFSVTRENVDRRFI